MSDGQLIVEIRNVVQRRMRLALVLNAASSASLYVEDHAVFRKCLFSSRIMKMPIFAASKHGPVRPAMPPVMVALLPGGGGLRGAG